MSIEITIQNDYILSSTTNPQGIITSASDHFLEVSGYTREEMIGQPHNILRHPDVPKQVFADMWATIQRKQNWTGIVKNKTKQGNYYYVQANVSPILQNNEIIGYVSIRTPADAKDISAINRTYPQIMQGKKRMVHGVIRNRWQQLTDRFQLKGPLVKTLSLASFIHLILALIIIASLFYRFQLSKVEPKLLAIEELAIAQHIDHLISEKIEGVKNIAFAYASRPTLHHALQDPSKETLSIAREEIESIRAHFAAISDYRRLRASLINLDGEALVNSYEAEPSGTARFALFDAVTRTYQGVGGLSWGANDIGFGVSGYGPIFNDAGQLIGAIVVSGGLGSMARELRKQNRDWLLWLDADAISGSAGALPASLLHNHKLSDTMLLANNHWFEQPMIEFVTQHQQQLNSAPKTQGAMLLEGYMVIQLPVFDDQGQPIGRHIFKQNNSQLIQARNQEYQQTLLFLIAISLSILVIMSLSIFSVYRRVVAPVKRATDFLEKTAKTYRFNERIIEFDRADEVSKIFQAYNQQANTLQHAFSEINDVMHAVQKGDYTQRVQAELKGDLRTIKQNINHAIEAIDLNLAAHRTSSSAASQAAIQKTNTDYLIMAHHLLNQLIRTHADIKSMAAECQHENERAKALANQLDALIQQSVTEKSTNNRPRKNEIPEIGQKIMR
ncbi:PAS domain-containing protein [Thiomicrospira microaerophila]|uniref:PAS domain-containing protein n=1 Tax=Thiomicrospira microaerophila TaxID=406020 RepID=UPI0005CB5279|nr:PAS domain-containing protein [Thiomicrospira microaerophila]